MLNQDKCSKDLREKLVNKSMHESHLEGHEVSEAMRLLYNKFVDGKMTIEEVIQARLS
jgi:hypothetical protein